MQYELATILRHLFDLQEETSVITAMTAMKPMSPKVCQLGCVTSVYNCAQSTVIQDPSC